MAKLPAALQARLEATASAYFAGAGITPMDFSAPRGAPALLPPDSMTWRVMKNPVALAVGGVAAVILELAEPRVRTGVWEHTNFRRDPVTRMKRTGHAAMVSVYAPADTARAMIASVVRAHSRIEGHTPAGEPYRANDEELLNWVQATASYGFLEAYRHFAGKLSGADIDRYFAEQVPGAALFGAVNAPRNRAEMHGLISAMRPKLERSDLIFEMLDIVNDAPLLPRILQRSIVRAAVDLMPDWVRMLLGLGHKYSMRAGDETFLRMMAQAGESLVLENAPPSQACVRLGLPADYLYTIT